MSNKILVNTSTLSPLADAVRTATGTTNAMSAAETIEKSTTIVENGGSAVASVNGKIGVVELNYTDVGAPPSSRTINGKSLEEDIILTTQDIGAPTTEAVAELETQVNTNTTNIATLITEVKQRDRVGNLLDNSWFVNPINQRGKTVYTGIGYTIDRWRTWGEGNITVGNGYISVSQSLWQYVANIDASKTHTAAICLADGRKYVYSGIPNNGGMGEWSNTIFCGVENGRVFFRIEDNMDDNIVWVALYEGAYTAETLPAYVYKGYAAELAECRRYFQRKAPDNYGVVVLGHCNVFTIKHPDMRIIPTVTIRNPTNNSIGSVASYTAGGEFPTEIVAITKDRSVVKVASGTPGNTYMLSYDASADL